MLRVALRFALWLGGSVKAWRDGVLKLEWTWVGVEQRGGGFAFHYVALSIVEE